MFAYLLLVYIFDILLVIPLNEGLNLFFEFKAFLHGTLIIPVVPVIFVYIPSFGSIGGFRPLEGGMNYIPIRIFSLLVFKGVYIENLLVLFGFGGQLFNLFLFLGILPLFLQPLRSSKDCFLSLWANLEIGNLLTASSSFNLLTFSA